MGISTLFSLDEPCFLTFIGFKAKSIYLNQADFNLADVDARCERVLCPTNSKKIPKNPSAFSVVNRFNCTQKINKSIYM